MLTCIDKQGLWPDHLISLDETQLDALIEHAAVCPYHEAILDQDEKVFLVGMRASIELLPSKVGLAGHHQELIEGDERDPVETKLPLQNYTESSREISVKREYATYERWSRERCPIEVLQVRWSSNNVSVLEVDRTSQWHLQVDADADLLQFWTLCRKHKDEVLLATYPLNVVGEHGEETALSFPNRQTLSLRVRVKKQGGYELWVSCTLPQIPTPQMHAPQARLHDWEDTCVLSAPSGMGKTALAALLLHNLSHGFSEDVWHRQPENLLPESDDRFSLGTIPHRKTSVEQMLRQRSTTSRVVTPLPARDGYLALHDRPHIVSIFYGAGSSSLDREPFDDLPRYDRILRYLRTSYTEELASGLAYDYPNRHLNRETQCPGFNHSFRSAIHPGLKLYCKPHFTPDFTHPCDSWMGIVWLHDHRRGRYYRCDSELYTSRNKSSCNHARQPVSPSVKCQLWGQPAESLGTSFSVPGILRPALFMAGLLTLFDTLFTELVTAQDQDHGYRYEDWVEHMVSLRRRLYVSSNLRKAYEATVKQDLAAVLEHSRWLETITKSSENEGATAGCERRPTQNEALEPSTYEQMVVVPEDALLAIAQQIAASNGETF